MILTMIFLIKKQFFKNRARDDNILNQKGKKEPSALGVICINVIKIIIKIRILFIFIIL